MRVLSGRELASAVRDRAATDALRLQSGGTTCCLAVVTATRDEASAWYVRSLTRAAEKCHIAVRVLDLAEDPRQVGERLADLTEDRTVHGIIVQTPLPGNDVRVLAELIDPGKDVDGASPISLGRLTAGTPAFAPATAQAVVALLDHHDIAISGRRVVVVGRSLVVGRPLAQLLLQRDATVTICHSKTADLPAVTRSGEIVIAAAGRARLISEPHIAPGTIVVDVGTNPTEDGGLVGDVDEQAVAPVAAALSPVPGGVGPVTTALLLRNTVTAAGRVAADIR